MRKELIAWSKWIIAINFGAATGCIIAFDKISPNLPSESPLLWAILLAIFFFALSVVVSAYFTFDLTLQTLPEKKYRFLGELQILLFITGLVALFAWIGLKAFKIDTNKVITKEKRAEIKLKDNPVEVTIKLSSPEEMFNNRY